MHRKLVKKKGGDETISIAKALSIITVVVGHSPVPHYLCIFISAFHMPLFFYLSGYFFKETNATDIRQYFIRKVQGVYWQYLKWVLPVLWLHNLFYYIGFYSELGGSQIISLKDLLVRTITNILFMNGSDVLTGGTWFLKDLFYEASSLPD